ncbi:MAG: MarR family transcriptional regulator [Lachnospiraceae bacterium]|nr:MarR family transcriptional regulator [Lachnospiraceae bacterium]MBD5482679.1 MarR family transcriptional regulator [Lachnospiraceae bacterium]
MPAIMKTLNNISRSQAMYRKNIISAENLCPNHYAFVLAVCYKPGRSQDELARAICLDKSTVARALAHLEKHGYITRLPNEKDRRQYLVHPTEKMLELYPKVQLANQEWNARLTENVSPEELEVFHRVLSRMEQNAKKITDELEVHSVETNIFLSDAL